jgi:hypothetical protein
MRSSGPISIGLQGIYNDYKVSTVVACQKPTAVGTLLAAAPAAEPIN